MKERWIKIYEKFLHWGWHTDPHMVSLFVHLLLTANTEDGWYMDTEVKRGQILTSRARLCELTGLTDREVRTAMANLEKTGETTKETTKRGTLITICKFDYYQAKRPRSVQENDQRASNPETPYTLSLNSTIGNRRKKEDCSFSSPYNPPSFSGGGWEEQQEEFFISEFFFKNISNPVEEFRKFRNYNNTGGRHWAKMDASERQSAFELWKPKGKDKPRFRPEVLSVWRKLYDALGASGASRQVTMSALDDGINILVRDAGVQVCCPEALQSYIESHLGSFRGIMKELIGCYGKTKLYYLAYATE